MPTLTYLKAKYPNMNETKPSISVAPKPQAPANSESTKPKVDKAAAVKYLKEVHDYLLTFDGKIGYNPHFQLAKLAKLEKDLNLIAIPDSTLEAIMALTKAEPKV